MRRRRSDDDDDNALVPEQVRPDWERPSAAWVPGVVPLELVVGRSDTTAVVLSHLDVYPTGIAFEVQVIRRGPTPGWGRLFEEVDDLDDEGTPRGPLDFRWGLELGSSELLTASRPWEVGKPTGPLLTPLGGRGGSHESKRQYWLWPLPADESLAVVCEWAAVGIENVRHELDVTLVLSAAARSKGIWA